jgi:hypothetical protein
MTELVILILLMFHPSGTMSSERYPLTVQKCVPDKDGRVVEDSSCGMRACLFEGQKKAAEKWGILPGSNFNIMCHKDTGEEVTKGTGAGGGHPALNFDR